MNMVTPPVFDARASRREANCGRLRVKEGAGFTLIELMIVVAIIAILAAIALPAYSRYVVKTKRAAATACLSEYANYMERYYTTNLRYDQDASGTAHVIPALDCSTPEQTGNDYNYTTTVLSANAFTFQAKPKNGQATSDTQCAILTINQKGARTDSGTGSVSDCW